MEFDVLIRFIAGFFIICSPPFQSNPHNLKFYSYTVLNLFIILVIILLVFSNSEHASSQQFLDSKLG
jgi:hypothetical protein